MLDELQGNQEEFRRKYGIAPPASFFKQKDPDIEALMQKVAQKGKKDKFSEDRFVSSICSGIRNHVKDSKKKVFLINAVNMDKLCATEKAYFLATDYHGGMKVFHTKEDLKDFKGTDSKTKYPLEPTKLSADSKEGRVEDQHSIEEEVHKAGPKSTQEDERNYCVCKKGWGGSASLAEDMNMIGCDGLCKDWYHPSCIGMTKFEASMIATNGDNIVWMCKACVVEHELPEKTC